MHDDNNDKNNSKNKLVYAGIIFAAISLTMITAPTILKAAAPTPTATPAPIATTGSHFDTVQTFQDEKHIVITITKNGTAPEGPIVVIPPPEGGKNGTILTPGENTTKDNPGNVTVITPSGNVTEIPNGNVTHIDNGTVIVPPDRNITETPANVTVIDPPAPIKPETNQTTQPTHCTCNQTNASIPSVIVTPAPGQNVTTQPHPIPTPPVETNITKTNTTETNTTKPAPVQPTDANVTKPISIESTNITKTNSTETNSTTAPPMVPNATRK